MSTIRADLELESHAGGVVHRTASFERTRDETADDALLDAALERLASGESFDALRKVTLTLTKED